MTDHKNEKEFTVAGHKATVWEMTVLDVREWLKQVENDKGEADFIDGHLMDGYSLSDLTHMSSFKLDELQKMTPSEIDYLADLCKEKNARFFALVRRRVQILNGILGIADAT